MAMGTKYMKYFVAIIKYSFIFQIYPYIVFWFYVILRDFVDLKSENQQEMALQFIADLYLFYSIVCISTIICLCLFGVIFYFYYFKNFNFNLLMKKILDYSKKIFLPILFSPFIAITIIVLGNLIKSDIIIRYSGISIIIFMIFILIYYKGDRKWVI